MPRWADKNDDDLGQAYASLAGVFEEAIKEENEAQAVMNLLDDVVRWEARVVCAETLGSYQLDAALVLRERAREIVESKGMSCYKPAFIYFLLISGFRRDIS